MTPPKATSFHEKVLAVQKAAHALNLSPEAEGQVQSRTYKYLTIQKLHAAVLPLLFEQGLAWVCSPAIYEGQPVLAYSLSDGDTDIRNTIPLIGVADMQKLGSAITYARRYVLLSVLGLVPDTDDDGKAATEKAASVRQAVPTIPLDRAKKILEAAQAAALATDTTLSPGLQAKLTEVGCATGKIGHLTVDQAEDIEAWIAKETA